MRDTIAQLSALIRAKRKTDDIGLREAAKASKVSASTLSRLERGIASSLPDFATLTNLAEWLGIPISSILNEREQPHSKKVKAQLQTPEQIAVYLRADKNLSPGTADALYKSFTLLYDQFVNTNKQSKP